MFKRIIIFSIGFFNNVDAISLSNIFHWPKKCEDAILLFTVNQEMHQKSIPMSKAPYDYCKVEYQDIQNAIKSVNAEGDGEIYRIETEHRHYDKSNLDAIIKGLI